MDKVREEFEAWWRSEGHSGFAVNSSGDYVFSHTQTSWVSWKASRAALCIELPEPWLENRDMVCGFDEIKDRLDKSGASYK